jgi:hypothetical protein
MANRFGVVALVGALVLGAIGLADEAAAQQARATQFVCGGTSTRAPQIAPVIYPSMYFGEFDNIAFDCQMWQAFIFLNWPAQPGQPGKPAPRLRFGTPGTVVWETYKTADQVFLPNGIKPAPWGQVFPQNQLTAAMSRAVASGRLRFLTQTSKVSPDLQGRLDTMSLKDSSTSVLDEIKQVGGGILYDQAKQPVYYEMLMNEDEFNYIVTNSLYNAKSQLAFAQSNVIAVPNGATQYGPAGAIELKAAWKILTQAELSAQPLRFHTAQAVVLRAGVPVTVTVGLVALHISQSIQSAYQAAWATFAQVDNAPIGQPATTGTYNFFNPGCAACKINDKSTNPTQVVEATPDDPSAVGLNTYMQAQIKAYSAAAPWQFYKLVNVQWPTKPVNFSQSGAGPAATPLPNGTPNTPTLVNAAIETFLQQPNTGCFSCHIYATVAPVGGKSANLATSYSFLFGHAKGGN